MPSSAFSLVTLAAAQAVQNKEGPAVSQVEYELLAALLSPQGLRRHRSMPLRPHLMQTERVLEPVEGFDPRD